MTSPIILSASAFSVNRKKVIALTAILLSGSLLSANKATAQTMPAFVELDAISQAVIGRICMNQVIRIPENMQKNIGIEQKDEIKKCMIYYKIKFNAKQLAVAGCYWRSSSGEELIRCLKETERMPE